MLLDAGLLNNDSERIQVRCPHCDESIDLQDGRDLDEIVCDACGGGFQTTGIDGTASLPSDSSKQIDDSESKENSLVKRLSREVTR